MHGPASRGELVNELNHPKENIYAFSLVVCLRKVDGQYQMLLVQEFESRGFWLPGGRVDPGEDLIQAAHRECLEEAGCHINVTGVLQFQYSPSGRGFVRLRAIFLAELADESQQPKTLPDFESMGAVWASFEEIEALNERGMLRGREPLQWARYLQGGGKASDLSVLGSEE